MAYFTKRYQDYLRSPAWQRKRQQVFAVQGKVCKACGRYGTDVNHLDYSKLGREDPRFDLQVLCNKCHKAMTAYHRRNRRRGLRRNMLYGARFIKTYGHRNII